MVRVDQSSLVLILNSFISQTQINPQKLPISDCNSEPLLQIYNSGIFSPLFWNFSCFVINYFLLKQEMHYYIRVV